MSASPEISPQQAKAQLNDRKQSTLIDVREPAEWAAAHLDGAHLIPMGSVSAELQTIEGFSDLGNVLVLCHHGVRSLQVVMWLRAHGIENCYSVAGGIDRWSLEVDPSIPRY